MGCSHPWRRSVTAALSIGPSAAVEVDELVQHRLREVVRFEVTERVHGGAHLLEVRHAGGAVGKVLLESPELVAGHDSLEVVGHELDRVTAHECPAAVLDAPAEG